MSSEGSCDTEDWSNDAENSTLHHRNKLHFKIYSNRNEIEIEIEIEIDEIEMFNCYSYLLLFIIQYYCFYCIFDQIKPWWA